MGGTFDPVHQGHLQGALDVSEALKGADVYLMPTKIPVHKTPPKTSIEDRQAMLELAIVDYPQIKLDLRELNAVSNSYTIDTLTQLRAEYTENSALIMVIGMDSFNSLPTWKSFEKFLDLCNIIVLQRPNYEVVKNAFHRHLLAHRVIDAAELREAPAGKLLFLQQTPIDVSATEIRQQFQLQNHSKQLPAKVVDYIQEHHLYTQM
jgi:nicotinate-nucleotide adenylyltransferase